MDEEYKDLELGLELSPGFWRSRVEDKIKFMDRLGLGNSQDEDLIDDEVHPHSDTPFVDAYFGRNDNHNDLEKLLLRNRN